MKKNKAVDEFIESHKDKKVITLVYAVKDEEHTHALVLKAYLKQEYAR
ncbi:MAG: DUF488 family protein [Bacteroidetes bacterium]|nr:DUF488 family protein [Bacteroidota bacterium]